MRYDELIKSYDKLDIKKLPEKIKEGKYEFVLIRRNNKKLLYAQYPNGHPDQVVYRLIKNMIKPWRTRKVAWAKRRNLKIDFSGEPEWYEAFPAEDEHERFFWLYPTREMAEKAFESR